MNDGNVLRDEWEQKKENKRNKCNEQTVVTNTLDINTTI